MDYANVEREYYEWIEEIKNGGSVPFTEIEDTRPNGWSTPPNDRFMVRGPNYLSDKVKIPAGEYLLKPIGFDWLKGPTKISQVLTNPNHRINKTLAEHFPTKDENSNHPFIWAFNLQLPGKDNYCAIAYFASLEPVHSGSLTERFLTGDDPFRNSRLKLIANMVKAPWIVRTAVGEQAICILGRALTCKYFSGSVNGSGFIEVDVDIASSIVANAIVHLAFGYITTLTVDLAFLIESQAEEELPEQILGAVRFAELDPESAGVYENQVVLPEASGSEASLGTRIWKSFGFSQLRGQNNPDESTLSLNNNNDNNNDNDDSNNNHDDDDDDDDEFDDCDDADDMVNGTLDMDGDGTIK